MVPLVLVFLCHHSIFVAATLHAGACVNFCRHRPQSTMACVNLGGERMQREFLKLQPSACRCGAVDDEAYG